MRRHEPTGKRFLSNKAIGQSFVLSSDVDITFVAKKNYEPFIWNLKPNI